MQNIPRNPTWHDAEGKHTQQGLSKRANATSPKGGEDTTETQQTKYINTYSYKTKQTLNIVVIWIVQRCLFANLGGPLPVQPPTTDSMPRFMTDPHEIRVDEESKLTLHGLLQYYVPWREENFIV